MVWLQHHSFCGSVRLKMQIFHVALPALFFIIIICYKDWYSLKIGIMNILKWGSIFVVDLVLIGVIKAPSTGDLKVMRITTSTLILRDWYILYWIWYNNIAFLMENIALLFLIHKKIAEFFCFLEWQLSCPQVNRNWCSAEALCEHYVTVVLD